MWIYCTREYNTDSDRGIGVEAHEPCLFAEVGNTNVESLLIEVLRRTRSTHRTGTIYLEFDNYTLQCNTIPKVEYSKYYNLVQ